MSEVHERIASLKGFIVDLDGTTYIGDRLIAGTTRFFEAVMLTGKQHVFITNNSSTTGDAYVQKLRRLGLRTADGAVLTSGEATAMVLRRKGYRRLFPIATPAFEAELSQAGFVLTSDAPDCVVLGFDKTLTYAKLETATRYIRSGVPFVATHPDVVCPTEDGYIPDCGAMIALLQAATGVAPLVIGKPEPLLVEMALDKLGLKKHEVAVIGDRLYTDIAMGRRAGTRTILVLSGETTAEMTAVASDKPDFIVSDVGVLADILTNVTAQGRPDALASETA